MAIVQVLQKIRGQEDVEMEFQDIITQTREANAIKHPLRALLKPCYRPQLVISLFIAVVQQLTGKAMLSSLQINIGVLGNDGLSEVRAQV